MWTTLLKILLLIALVVTYEQQQQWLELIPVSARILKLLLQFLLFAVIGQLLVDILSWWWRKRKGLTAERTDTVILGLQNVYYLLLTGALIITVLGFYGIDYKTLFTTLSIVAAAIAIISKDFVSEIISGIIISFSGEISIDDYVQIGAHKGKVIDLTLTKVAMLNDDDDIIFIPNNTVYTSEVVNYTKRATRRVSIEFEVPFSAVTTIEELELNLIEAISDYEHFIEPGSYGLRTVDIRKDSLLLKFQYTISQRERELERDIRKKTVRRVVNYVKHNSQSGDKVIAEP